MEKINEVIGLFTFSYCFEMGQLPLLTIHSQGSIYNANFLSCHINIIGYLVMFSLKYIAEVSHDCRSILSFFDKIGRKYENKQTYLQREKILHINVVISHPKSSIVV